MLKDGPVRPTSSEGSNGSLSERLAKAKPTSTKPNSEPSLAEKLARKASAERAEVEELTRSELRRLGESLRSESESALRSTESAMRRRSTALMSEMERIERRQRLVPLWIASGSIAIVLSGLLVLWGASAWASFTLSRDRAALEAVRSEIASERQALNVLRQQTGGVRVQHRPNGTFVVLPEGTNVSENWNCTEAGTEPCFRVAPPVPNVRPRD